MVRRVACIRFDFAKTHLDSSAIAILSGLAEAQDFAGRRKTLFSGGIANPTEDRAAEHSAERGDGAPESVHAAQALHQRMRMMIDANEAGACGENSRARGSERGCKEGRISVVDESLKK